MIPITDWEELTPLTKGASGPFCVRLWNESSGLSDKMVCSLSGDCWMTHHAEDSNDFCPVAYRAGLSGLQGCPLDPNTDATPVMEAIFRLVHYHLYHSENGDLSGVTRLRVNGHAEFLGKPDSPAGDLRHREDLSNYVVMILDSSINDFISTVLDEVFRRLAETQGHSPDEYES